MSLEMLGKKLFLSKNSVNYRIKRLEKKGIIKNYYTIIDMFKLNYKCIRCYIIYQSTTPEIKNEIIKYFCSNKNIGIVGSMIGSIDLNAIFWVQHINDFQRFWLNTINKYGNYFDKQYLSLYYKVQTYPPTYLILEDDKTIDRIKYKVEIGGGKIENIDQIDMQILNIIAYNSRIPIVSIAKKLNLSIRTVHYRIQKLKRMKIIKSFTTNIDINKLGFRWFKVDIYLEDQSKKMDVIQYIKHNPNIIAIDTTTGYSDVELEFHVKDIYILGEIMDNLTQKFQNIIKNYSYFYIKNSHKYYYFPEL
jgi:Lrp/AsnC family transcriptional regulator for asnA, asnC and gidA